MFERRSADHDPRNARREPAFDIGGRADAAAQLDASGEGGDDRFDRAAVLRRTGERAIEVDHMQMVRTGFGKEGSLRRRIVAIDGRAVHIAFGKTDNLAVLEVDSGKYDHDLVSSAASARG